MQHPHAQNKHLTPKQKLEARIQPNLVKNLPVKDISSEDAGAPQHFEAAADSVDITTKGTYSFKDGFSEPETQRPSIELPLEILQQILSYVAHSPSSQITLHAFSLASRSWYYAAIPLLYNAPRISGKNYDLFVRTVCPSINAHIRTNGLSELVKTLDMSSLVHNGSKSLTARLLGRVKGHLEVFVAPQASFAYEHKCSSIRTVDLQSYSVNCLAALSRCQQLVHLDLSLVSESLVMADLFHSISSLHHLESFHFPRSSSNDHRTTGLFNTWPLKLRKLQIAGGIRDESVIYFSTLPNTLTHLTFGDCPNLSLAFVRPLLTILGPHLQYLKIDSNLPKLNNVSSLMFSLNDILDVLPALRHLTIRADYICESFFASGKIYNSHNPHTLESLQLDCLENDEITSDLVWDAVEDGPLKNLRRLRVSRKLGWTQDEEGRRSVRELSSLMMALAWEGRGENAPDVEINAGVWVYD